MIGRGELSANVRAISGLLEYGQILKQRLKEIRSEKPILGRNADLEIEEQLVERELSRIRAVMNAELNSRKKQIKDLESNQSQRGES